MMRTPKIIDFSYNKNIANYFGILYDKSVFIETNNLENHMMKKVIFKQDSSLIVRRRVLLCQS